MDAKTSGSGTSSPFGGGMAKTDKGHDFIKEPGGTKIGTGNDFVEKPEGETTKGEGVDFTDPKEASVGEQKSGQAPTICPESIPTGGKYPFQPGVTEVQGKRASQQHVQTSPTPAHKPFKIGKG